MNIQTASIAVSIPDWVTKGQVVFHKQYGIGEITSRLGNTITVRYSSQLLVHNWQIEGDKLSPSSESLQPQKISYGNGHPKLVLNQVHEPFQEIVGRWMPLIRDIAIDRGSNGEYAAIPDWLHPTIQQALSLKGIQSLYSHQVDGFEAFQKGQDLVYGTATASGKSIGYQIPILQQAIASRKTTLILAPYKALIADQFNSFSELIQLVEQSAQYQQVEVPLLRLIQATGDNRADRKGDLSSLFRFLITNPDCLEPILNRTTRADGHAWRSFLKQLGTVVIDEVQLFESLFGAHMANLIRRLKVAVKRVGGNPDEVRFIMCSASIGNFKQLYQLLSGKGNEPTVITRSGAPNAGRTLISFKTSAGTLAKVSQLSVALREQEIPSILFFNSKSIPKRMLSYVTRIRRENDSSIRLFYGSTPAHERERIIQDITAGRIYQIYATSAIEAGVNLPQLQASLVWGFPPSAPISSLRQRWGRAGRANDPALVGFIPQPQQLIDLAYSNNMKLLVAGESEAVLLNPDDPIRIEQHLLAAIADTYLLPDEVGEFFGQEGEFIAGRLLEEGRVAITDQGWLVLASGLKREYIAIRGNRIDQVSLIDQETGYKLEELSYEQAIRDTHLGAVYSLATDGNFQKYQVVRWEENGQDERRIYLQQVDENSSYITEPVTETIIERVRDISARTLQTSYGSLLMELYWGKLTNRVTGYSTFRQKIIWSCSNPNCANHKKEFEVQNNKCMICRSPLTTSKISFEKVEDHILRDVKSVSIETPVFRLSADEGLEDFILKCSQVCELPEEEMTDDDIILCALHTLIHQAILTLPVVSCYSQRDVQEKGCPEDGYMEVMDRVDGGIGTTQFLFEQLETIIHNKIECNCKNGCVQCTSLNFCLDGNHLTSNPLSKSLIEAIAPTEQN